LKQKNLKRVLVAVAVLGIVLIIVGFVVMQSGTEHTNQQRIPFSTFSFSGSTTLVSGVYYYVGGAQQFHINAGAAVEVLDIQPPAGFNGSLTNVYFAVWESAPQSGSSPDELIRASTLPATYVVKSGSWYFQLLSDESLQNLASGSFWTGDFVYSYKFVEDIGLLISGGAILASGIIVAILALYGLVRISKRRLARRA
jgi:hypothetical protein